jgi:tetratricopeptide (TPR) repeat protein
MSHLSYEEPGNSASRVWEFILNAGAQLQAWKLDNLAIFFWENALADPALIRLQTQAQGEQVQTRSFDVRTRLAALKIARADPIEREEIIANYKRYSLQDGLVPLGEALEALGAYARSIEISHHLWELDPVNPHALRNVISACRTGGDLETLEQIVGRCVRDGLFRSTEAAHRDLTLQLVDLLEKRGALADAIQTLADNIDRPANAPGERRSFTDGRLLLRLAQLYERGGQSDRADAAYRRLLGFEPGNTVAPVALANLLEARGNIPEALTILEKSSGPDIETKLADLYLKMGRRQEALSTLEQLPSGSHIAAALRFAETLIARNERRDALVVLRNEATKTPDLRANFPLQSKIIELLAPDEEHALIAREWRRLRQIAGDDRNLLSAYFALLVRESSRLHWENEAEREMKDDWDDGDGQLSAGTALLEWELRRGESSAAQNTGAQLIARNDLIEPFAQRIAALAAQFDRADLLLQSKARLARLNPLDYAKTIDWAQALFQHRMRREALQALDTLTWRAAMNEEIAASLGETMFAFGEAEKARRFFQLAVANDPAARNYRAYLGWRGSISLRAISRKRARFCPRHFAIQRTGNSARSAPGSRRPATLATLTGLCRRWS